MPWGYPGSYNSVDYICTCCGSINKSFDTLHGVPSKYSIHYVYCFVCKKDTKSIMIGDYQSDEIIKNMSTSKRLAYVKRIVNGKKI